MRVKYDETTPYCTPEEVARYFKKDDPFRHANLSQTRVEDMILDWCDDFDKRTHHSWRENKVIDEYHDWDGFYRWWSGRPIRTTFNGIRTPLSDNNGDKLEIWDGNTWVDWVSDSTKTEGRDGDYWVESSGKIWIYRRFWLTGHPRIRLTYRFGELDIHRDVRRAVAKRTAAELLLSDQYTNLIPGTGDDSADPTTAAQMWIDDYEKVAERNKQIPDVDGY